MTVVAREFKLWVISDGCTVIGSTCYCAEIRHNMLIGTKRRGVRIFGIQADDKLCNRLLGVEAYTE